MTKKKNPTPLETEESLPSQARETLPWVNPIALSRRFRHEADRLIEDLATRRGWLGSVLSSRWSDATFVPEVEMFEKDGHLVVRVDLPGLRKEDVTVHATDDELTIQGERRQEHEEQGRNFYRTERSYGAFRRTIPLPEGVKSETVHATFRQGVLEVTMDAPAPRAPRGRTVRIWTEPDAATSKSA